MFDFSENNIQELLEGMYDGSITEYELPENLYYAIADFLKSGLYKGFGGGLDAFEAGTSDLELLTELRENIYMFSAAKTFQQVKDMRDELTFEDSMRTFSEFKELAGSIFDTYNEVYLHTEYDTAIASAQMGAKWNKIEAQKDILPYVRLSVVEDANTSDICEPLDGLTVRTDDPILDTCYPPNHFGCRTLAEQLSEDDGELSSKEDVDAAADHAEEHMDDIFKMNVGKDRVIFSDEHPYFDVSKGDKGFARENFGLYIPEDDE